MMTPQTSNLEFQEPEANCEIKVGTFVYVTPEGTENTADFILKTCAEDDEQNTVDKRFRDYNEQLTDEWEKLEDSGCMKIRYSEVIPCPLY
jgi:hypothetical protein